MYTPHYLLCMLKFLTETEMVFVRIVKNRDSEENATSGPTD
jgi:hypothetical protein